ncbi:putative integral membrane protein [Acanthocheilonema viteae]
MGYHSRICLFPIKICMYIMSGMNIVLAIVLLLLSLMQKSQGVHAIVDYLCFIIFILIAILAILSATKENLIWSLLGAAITILVLLFIALVYHLFYCYTNRVDIFEVAGSALIYLAIMTVSGFCTFIAIRWRTFVNFRKKVNKQRMNASKGSKALLEQEERRK